MSVIRPNGERRTLENIRPRLAKRDLLSDIRLAEVFYTVSRKKYRNRTFTDRDKFRFNQTLDEILLQTTDGK